MIAKIGKFEFEKNILKVLEKTAIPMTVMALDEHCNLAYATIAKMLPEMKKNGTVKKLKSFGRALWVLPTYQPEFED